MGLISKVKKIFNSKKQQESEREILVNYYETKISELKSEYQKAISANNSILKTLEEINNDVMGKNVLKAHKENRERINEFIVSAIEKNCEKNAEIQEKYQ